MKLRIRLNNNSHLLSLWLMVASFVCYTGMYAVRKSFLAFEYHDQYVYGMDLKTALIISQIIGYMLSKFMGVKLISGLDKQRRQRSLIGFVFFGLMMLLALALTPAKYAPLVMFLNGIPLGMVFGLVISYLEGRSNSELLTAALSSTFIFSTGIIKSISRLLFDKLSMYEMSVPFLVGLVFFPFFLIAVWMLGVAPDPNEKDVQMKQKRVKMTGADRITFAKKHGYLLILLVGAYVMLTVLRDFRDNFMVDLWSEIDGGSTGAWVYTATETPIAVLTLIISASLIAIKDNRRALLVVLCINLFCSGLLLLSTFFYGVDAMSAQWWMMVSGFALYLPYILFHTSVFERLIPVLGSLANVAFLFYLSDSLGYAGSVTLLLIKDFFFTNISWMGVYLPVVMTVSIGLLFTMVLSVLFVLRYKRFKNS